MVAEAILPHAIPVTVSFIVAIQRSEPISSGPMRLGMRVKDHFGNWYPTKRVTFKDSAHVAAKYQTRPGLPTP